ncbi:methyl-accepting chemotaxis protein [Thiohalobacter sp. IOR34]|uniref:methyl-accepting chemotaxis protein n=1 Tax=Thiohalobacter sp. IOR34 TaxID=3057176 RepID=UPI0025B212AC|nr:methyl-accepting chemotaxis protein [Thiohalobacter sp. IOR34]WJW75127.1 methyl-accepting chemotaxis protein [Thiohalobacter sp. IOR34]
MTIKTKLALFAGISILAISVMLLMQVYAWQRAEALQRGLVSIADIETDVLRLRGYGQAFQMYRDPDSLKAFDEYLPHFRHDIGMLAQLIADIGADAVMVQPLRDAMQRYITDFHVLAASMQRTGFKEDQGVRGAMRQAVHEVESRLNELSEERLLNDMLMLRRHEKDFLLREQDDYLRRHERAFMHLQANLAVLPLAAELKARISDGLQRYRRYFRQLAAEVKLQRMGEGSLAMRLNQASEQLEARLLESVNLIQQLFARTGQSTKRVSLMLSLLMGGGLLFAAIYMVGSISSRLNRVTLAMEQISEGNADLSVSLPEDGNDEITRLSKAFNRFETKLDDTVRQIMLVASELSLSSQRAQTFTTTTNQALEEQVQAIARLTDRVSEMSETSQTVNSVIADGVKNTEQVRQESAVGQNVVAEALDSMRRLTEEVGVLGGRISSLAKHHESIGTVLDMIVTIAEQTNLLNRPGYSGDYFV